MYHLSYKCPCGQENEIMANKSLPLSISFDVPSDDVALEMECLACKQRIQFFARQVKQEAAQHS